MALVGFSEGELSGSLYSCHCPGGSSGHGPSSSSWNRKAAESAQLLLFENPISLGPQLLRCAHASHAGWDVAFALVNKKDREEQVLCEGRREMGSRKAGLGVGRAFRTQ